MLKSLRTARLVTLTGPGGVGKTRLVTEAAGRLGVGLVRPAGAGDRSGRGAVHGARRARRPGAGHRRPRRPNPVRARSPAGRALGDREEMLVLDNCEHVIEAAAALAGQGPGRLPRLSILATSRQPLADRR